MNNKYRASCRLGFHCPKCQTKDSIDLREFDYEKYDTFHYIVEIPLFDAECHICNDVQEIGGNYIFDFVEN